MPITTHKPLILASGSICRKWLMDQSGLKYQVIPADVDESAIKEQMQGSPPAEIGVALAKAKAAAVSELHPDAYVIGGDQICAFEEQILDKPGDEATAIEHLHMLQGKTHIQYSAVCVYAHTTPSTCDTLKTTPPACGGGRGGAVPSEQSIDGSSRVAIPPLTSPPQAGGIDTGPQCLWSFVDQASLTMRSLTAEEIGTYVRLDQPIASCGAYKFESLGCHLFDEVQGSADTIKGMPLLPLLAALRELGVYSLA